MSVEESGGVFYASVLSTSVPALLRASPSTPPRVSRADRGSALRSRTASSRQVRRPRETPGGNKASAMGDEDPVMPVGENVTFENTYMQKPEDFGEVRHDTRHTRGSRRRCRERILVSVRLPRRRSTDEAIQPRPFFGTKREFCRVLTRSTLSTSSEPKRLKRDRGISSCAAPYRKS